MLFYFTNAEGKPVVYKAQMPGDAWTQTKGGRTITVVRSSCWARMGAIGGVIDAPELTTIGIQPSSDNNQTIGVKYVVRRGEKYFTGFGSSNDFSLIKKVDTYSNKDGSSKEVVSGNALHALEMATKRAKVAAIAAALGFDHNDVGEIVESYDYVINPGLRKIPAIGYKNNTASDLSRTERAQTIPAEKAEGISNIEEPRNAASSNPQPHKEVRAEQAATSNTASKAPAQTKPTPATVSKPPVAETTQPVTKSTDNNKDSDNPGEFVITFGKHKGKALITILSEDSGYIKWLVENSNNAEAKSKAAALLEKLPNLAHSQPPQASQSALSYKEQLKDFWKSRGYDPKTEVKQILEKALNQSNLSYNLVSEEDAKKLFAQREVLFPNKGDGGGDELDTKTKEMLGKAKCCVCEIELKEPEIKVSLKKAKDLNGRMLCFRHVRLAQDNEQPAGDAKCEKCNKVLDQQELQFIKEYDSAQLCTNCQVE